MDDVLLSDDFEDGIWSWTDWLDSPGWVQPGGGALVLETRSADHHTAEFAGDDEFTFGALAVYCPRKDADGRCIDPSDGWSSYVIEADVNVRRQVRAPLIAGENLPAAWEVGWIFFRFQDPQHYYFMIFKTHHSRDLTQNYGGLEIGKYNCERNCGVFEISSGKETLYEINAAETPGERADFLELDRWYRYRIEVESTTNEQGEAAVLISPYIDEQYMGSVLDDGHVTPLFGGLPATPPLHEGAVGMYAEDSEVWFDNVVVRRL